MIELLGLPDWSKYILVPAYVVFLSYFIALSIEVAARYINKK